jgi:hypothetical protein
MQEDIMRRMTIGTTIGAAAATLMMLATPLLSGVAHAGQVAKYKSNGGFANVWGMDASGCVGFGVSVWLDGSGMAQQTFLSYDVYNYCTGESLGWGYGAIPNTDLKINKKEAVLNTNPASSSGFSASGTAGAITLNFEVTGVYSNTYSGHSASTYGDYVYRSHGTWSERSASVSGRVMDWDIGSATGSVGTSLSRTIEIERGQ